VSLKLASGDPGRYPELTPLTKF